MFRHIFLLLLLALLNPAQAAGFQYNKQCSKAYRLLMSLQIEESEKILAAEKQQNPANHLTLLFDNYADVLKIFITEESTTFNRLEPNKARRLNALENSDKNSPYYRYAQAEINLQWALVRLKFEQYLKAFWEIQKAYKLLSENQRLYPDFYPNLKSLGAIHAIIGTVPEQFKWSMKLMGLQGNIDRGMKEIEQFLQKGQQQQDQLFREEGLVLYAFLLLHLQGNPGKAWQIAAGLPAKTSLLNCFAAADIALKTGHNEEAIAILEQKPSGNGFAPFYYLDYLLGVCKLNRLDADADAPLFKFVNNFKGSSYVKDAYQKLAWNYLLKNRPDKYRTFMQYALERGKQFTDSDKQAHKAAQTTEMPHPQLLKARLLFDGGYYSKALTVLQQIPEAQLNTTAQKLEYIYRKSRIYNGLEQYPTAIACYQQTILQSKDAPYYFAPKACLELGKIYEQQGNIPSATFYYRKAMEYKNHEYRNSIEQQAKAGLNRVKNP
ncbi:hypothetical protein C7N43_20430 [Sphingobacteriales bacterium UPWRP_1]|nr:hypothetical protein C7N43_20430 [Sphingobacteriales bacterium UPWRP_1]